ncbi:tetratricopeptide repeat protein [Psychroserpens sp.]
MKKIIIIAFVLVSGVVTAQTNFEKSMQKAFSLWQEGNTDEAENIFERISNADIDQWLPHYYIAQINSNKSWGQKDPTKLKAQLDKAQEHINSAMAISKDNPEIMVIQAHILTNWVAFDGMTYGMKYSGKITELYSKASAIAPENPRVVFGKAEWGMGSAKYFGQDTKPFCAEIEKSIELFANFKPESELHPNWGKERAEQVTKSCKE